MTDSSSLHGTPAAVAPFHERVLRWFDLHGRHDLPWQHPRTAYRVWLSEVMLQQTQVAAVIPYFRRFLERFPDLAALAAAPVDEAMKYWAGLGYYARARNLHRAACEIVERHGGVFPAEFEAVAALPGIGRSTAGAILSQAYGQRHAILDGNVKRLLARHAAVDGWPGAPRVQTRLWAIAEDRLPPARYADYTQAMMDLGSAVCTPRRPACTTCPVSEDCLARLEDRVAQIPAPKPRRERPRRRAQVLLVEDARGGWLLERRPPAGIWGGLWCPPLALDDEDWSVAAVRLGLQIAGSAQALAPVQHGFTHFDLDLLPMRLRAGHGPTGAAEPSERAWIKLDRPEDWPALPAPMRKLLERLARQNTLPAPPPIPNEIPS